MIFKLHYDDSYVSMSLDGKEIFYIRRFYVRYHYYLSSDEYQYYTHQPYFRDKFERNFRKTFYCLGRVDL